MAIMNFEAAGRVMWAGDNKLGLNIALQIENNYFQGCQENLRAPGKIMNVGPL